MADFSLEELLQRAVTKATADWTLTDADFGAIGAATAPLSVELAVQFIRLMTAGQVMLGDVRTVTSNANTWVESGLDFAGRIMKPGVQGERLATGSRSKPTTFPVEITTALLRGEVPISDEAIEDSGAKDLQPSLTELIADRAGYDIEDFMINGDTAVADGTINALKDGWLKLAKGTGTNTTDAVSIGADYEAIFAKLLASMPNRFKRNLTTDGRFYVPTTLEEKYREQLATRGTPLGDLMLQGKEPVKYQGINIVGVPAMAVASGTPDTCNVLLTNKNNLYAGFQRQLRFETFRDPREGATSFIITARAAPQIAVVNATALATNVDVEP